MNNLDKAYTNLLKDILENGHQKGDRTGTGTISVFGRQIRHSMKEGFPLLTSKKMYMKGVITELLWFLRGETNIKSLIENDCNIWNGDAYKKYCNDKNTVGPLTMAQFIEEIKTNGEFAKKWGDLGPVYGKQWRSWERYGYRGVQSGALDLGEITIDEYKKEKHIDQIVNAINLLKTDPNSRRNRVSAWNVGELDDMTLPPCHTDFQFYTRELSREERIQIYVDKYMGGVGKPSGFEDAKLKTRNIPTRAISLQWQQRSCDTFLGLPFNIASYGLLLEIVAKIVNMVPEELIGNLGDTHLYLNHVEQAKEQIGRELTLNERYDLHKDYITSDKLDLLFEFATNENLDKLGVPRRTREPFPLPTLNINTEFWPTETGECGDGALHSDIDFLIKNMQISDFQIENYKSHSTIKAPLSN